MKRLTEFEKGRIIQLKEDQYSAWQVIKKLQESGIQTTIRNINKIFQKYLESEECFEKKVGRPSVMTQEQVEAIRSEVFKYKDRIAVQIQKSSRLNPNNASLSTIQRLLKSQGFRSLIAA
ncbi:hypothetical protein ABPG72_010886 [Tetrahymena utriculariae]